MGKEILSSKILVGIGLISYPLYLWHWPILSYLRIVFGSLPPSGIRIAALIFVFIASYCTYVFIEKPLRFSENRKRVTKYLLGSMLIVFALGISFYKANINISNYEVNIDKLGSMVSDAGEGEATKLKENTQILQVNVAEEGKYHHDLTKFSSDTASVDDLLWPAIENSEEGCKQLHPYTYYCKGAVNGNPSAALFGDSQANHFYRGLAAQLGKSGTSLINLGLSGCPPILGITSHYPNQADWCKSGGNLKILNFISSEPSIKTVYLAANWNLYILGRRFGSSDQYQPNWEIRFPSRPEVDTNSEVFRIGIKETIEILRRSNKKIVFIKQIPEINYSPKDCIMSRSLSIRLTERDCIVPRGDVSDYLNAQDVIINNILRDYPEIKLLNPVDFLCDDLLCYGFYKGSPLYRDALHLSKFGSNFIGAKLIKTY